MFCLINVDQTEQPLRTGTKGIIEKIHHNTNDPRLSITLYT